MPSNCSALRCFLSKKKQANAPHRLPSFCLPQSATLAYNLCDSPPARPFSGILSHIQGRVSRNSLARKNLPGANACRNITIVNGMYPFQRTFCLPFLLTKVTRVGGWPRRDSRKILSPLLDAVLNVVGWWGRITTWSDVGVYLRRYETTVWSFDQAVVDSNGHIFWSRGSDGNESNRTGSE